MPTNTVDPVMIDAIEQVIETKASTAEWDDDEMRSAMLEYARNEDASMENVSEGSDRGFSKAVFSDKWNEAKDAFEELKKDQETGSDVFPDPIAEAVDELEQLFEDLDETYGFGFNDRAIRMLLDKVERDSELPHPATVRQHLDELKSGIANDQEIEYITNEYRNWLDNFQDRHGSSSQPAQTQRGYEIGGQGARGGGQQADGIPVGGGPGQPSPRGRGGQGQQPQTDPAVQQVQQQVDDLRDTVSELAEAVKETAQDDGSDEEMVEIEEDGTVKRVPYHVAMANGLIGDDSSDEPDFMEKLQKAKEQGLIPDAEDLQDDRDLTDMVQELETLGLIGDDDDSQDALAEQIMEMMETMQQNFEETQKQTSERMAQAIENLNAAQQSSDDISMEDIRQEMRELYKEKEEEDRIDQLKKEIEATREELSKEVSRSRRSTSDKEPAEVKKKKIETDAELEQLRTAQETLRELPEQVGTLAEKLDPLVDRLSNPQQSVFMQPGGGGPQAQPPQQPQPQQEGRGGTEPQRGQSPEPATEDGGGSEPEPGAADPERAQEIRDRLNLDDAGNDAGTETEEGEA